MSVLRNDLRPLTAAFYLPQFHQIPENDEWWGSGFTEWTNVRRAEPQFEGHDHPLVPTSPVGAYDLTDPEAVSWQVNAATTNGIDAFVYYHYWFDGRRLLEKPLDNYLKSNHSMPFAICWANENWSRRWDGKDRELLISQNYGDSSAQLVFDSFRPYLEDRRYMRLGDKLAIFVHRVDHLPDAKVFADIWRRLAREAGLGELWLIASETFSGIVPQRYGFDAVGEFPPVGNNDLSTVLTRKPTGTSPNFKGRISSYPKLAERYINRKLPDFPLHRGLVPRWDNTARRMNSATVFVGSTPARYAEWLTAARLSEAHARGSRGLVLVNAWNEWAEGAFLEPDSTFGDRYLRASRWDWSPGREERDDDLTPLDGQLNIRGLAVGAASSTKNAVGRLRGLLP